MPSAVFDRYPRYDELTGWLDEFEAAFPNLVEKTSIGRSYEGRELWLLTVTNHESGKPSEKPAVWLDGNVHASEVTASVALVHLVDHLTRSYGSDPQVTRALDTRTFYVVPRVNPDGAELARSEVPWLVRGSVHPWPHADQLDGLIVGDIDRDGRMLQMRVTDPNGAWKSYPSDPRLLIARDPDEDGDGPYYRLLTEGRVQNYDGVLVPTAPERAGIDPNRQFPYKWERKVESPWDAGEYPGSEPEIAALLAAITERKNICAYFAYHTFSGVHIRAYSDQADEAFAADDLWTYRFLGDMATELTGYPSISGYHDFRYHPKSVIRGVGTDWAYDHLGVYAWTTEFWNALRAAGLDDAHPLEWFRTHPLDDELRLLAWVDENVPGGYVDWYPFDHPQLGLVELGGWNSELVFRNPPPHLLEAEIAPHSALATRVALSSPELRHRDTIVDPLGDGVWRIRVVVENAGWMSTSVTRRAVDAGYVLPLVGRIELPEGASLASGTPRVELGQLAGRALKQNAVRQFHLISDGTDDRTVAEWVVRAEAGSTCRVEVAHDRAGAVRVDVELR
ncbi:MAG: M14 family metallopeptidase [Ilumatobacter sp.]|uniref:M14 family metallopeptidase n=1 Tax=Ilumatobacter sp. TaxID=1967498 RepID=UPI00261BBD8B|nr:M14 family metallopeptidase [Ilumatobacter sp.]MDJ0769451.1 M14 family metallopeptidase [Ilumatobacter sp.]